MGTTAQISYSIIRSRRKTIGLEVKPDGSVFVRAPLRMPEKVIRDFVLQHENWIHKHQEILRKRKEELAAVDPLTDDDIRLLADQALKVIPERVAYYADIIGVTYGRITIRNQRTRWGSCSSTGNLNFNCLLMLTPPEVLDSVVVHELCHRKEMNHSKRFYDEVLRVFPEYHKWQKWLKDHGAAVLTRMSAGR